VSGVAAESAEKAGQADQVEKEKEIISSVLLSISFNIFLLIHVRKVSF
jgi:hypothetical protein